MRKKILFVDDEPKVLDGLGRLLRSMRKEWDMHFRGSGQEALDFLNDQATDVIVTDMRMPGMDGGELLTQVMDKYPSTVRIVLSGQSDRQMVFKSALPTHQYLSKPCDPEVLKSTVSRACALREVVENQAVQEAISKIGALPSLPETYLELSAELEKESCSAESVGSIISKDMGMTASILKIVNSSFFGFSKEITSPEQAVAMLGVEIVKGLVLSAHMMTMYDDKKVPRLSMANLWSHSVAAGAMAKNIAVSQGADRTTVEEAFIAAMLHDVGKLVLAAQLPDLFNQVLKSVRVGNRLVWEVERELLGTSHAEVGAYLLGLWGLPDNVIEAVVFHHMPSACTVKQFTPLSATHFADCLERKLVVKNEHYAKPKLDNQYFEDCGLSGRLREWAGICVATINEGAEQ